jgi:formylglycine-generating enzyme required for sulfatase activity
MIRVLVCWAVLSVSAPSFAAETKLVERWAVLIGVDDYANLKPLRYCGADQSALRERLIDSGFRPENIILLHDKAAENKYKPSQRNIEQQLRLVINSAEADDLLVVGFSGHGVAFEGKSYLCPSDGLIDDTTTLISLDGVYEQLRNCAARLKCVVVDACRDDPVRGGARSASVSNGTKQLAQSLQAIQLPEGVVLLNSCGPGEQSWEGEEFGHGVYMKYMLEGMSGPADADMDGAVSLNELQRYTSARTKSYVIGKFNQTQRPFSRHEGEADVMDFALLPVKGRLSTSATPANPLPTLTTPSNPTPTFTTKGLPGLLRPNMSVRDASGNSPNPLDGVSKDLLSTAEPITNSIGMKLVPIPAGEFQMGFIEPDKFASGDEKPVHRVRITKPFYMGMYEVTQGQWQAVMGTTPWKGQNLTKEDADCPATYISWDDAQTFCRKLGAQEGKAYSLPTEAQWEYACRAGTTSRFSFADESQVADYAWSNENTYYADEKYPHPVGRKKPNAWGLYDMHGNAEEWCNDFYDRFYYIGSPDEDPTGPDTGTERVRRGGAWGFEAASNHSALRTFRPPTYVNATGGFRVVLVP